MSTHRLKRASQNGGFLCLEINRLVAEEVFETGGCMDILICGFSDDDDYYGFMDWYGAIAN